MPQWIELQTHVELCYMISQQESSIFEDRRAFFCIFKKQMGLESYWSYSNQALPILAKQGHPYIRYCTQPDSKSSGTTFALLINAISSAYMNNFVHIKAHSLFPQ